MSHRPPQGDDVRVIPLAAERRGGVLEAAGGQETGRRWAQPKSSPTRAQPHRPHHHPHHLPRFPLPAPPILDLEHHPLLLSIPCLVQQSHELGPDDDGDLRPPFSPMWKNAGGGERRKQVSLLSLYCS